MSSRFTEHSRNSRKVEQE